MIKINENYDVIIVGGSYAGLAAGMALGRALRDVLIIDDGKPCNRQTPQSHNFLTNDGKAPAEIAALANLQVSKYHTVKIFNGKAINGFKIKKGFQINVVTGETFTAKNLIFATGIKDLLPGISGLAECWGISVLHCPFCHGYEVRQEKTGLFGNGDLGFDMTKLIYNWTKDLTLFTNGPATITAAQREILQKREVTIIENEIAGIEHRNGHLHKIIFKDGSGIPIKIIYAPSPFEQHCRIPESLGCELTDEGFLKIDINCETSVNGVYAIGDNVSKMRTVANAVSMGTVAGISVSKKMIMEEF